VSSTSSPIEGVIRGYHTFFSIRVVKPRTFITFPGLSELFGALVELLVQSDKEPGMVNMDVEELMR
jgi:hypothetical protein